MTTSCPRGAGVGVDGVETAAACLRVRILDIFSYQEVKGWYGRILSRVPFVVKKVAIPNNVICC